MKKTLARFLTISMGMALSFFACQSPIVPSSPSSQFRAITNPPINGFITRSGDKLLENGQVFRFQSINVPNLHIVEDSDWKRFPSTPNDWRRLTEFETRDAFQTLVQIGARVTRTYTFTVKGGKNNGNGLSHYYGPNNYDENLFRDFDRTLALANEYGIRLIIPLIDEWDWVGGRAQFAALNGGGDFYNSTQVKQAFKDWITYILNRTNTITGVKYKDDKAIMAWETGNELQGPPTSWTSEIAAHIKSQDSNHLVMDGANGNYDASLTNANVDIVTDHFYTNGGNNYVSRAQSNVNKTRGKKVFIIGEYGLTDFATIKATMDYIQSEPSIAGGMLWSLRYHAVTGGFLWHDDQGQMAYHFPGFDTNSVSNEKQIWPALRNASFTIRGLAVPPKEIPATAPVLLPQGNNTFAWQGAVGAETYTIQRAESASGPWTTVASNLIDADRPFKPWQDTNVQSGKTYFYRIQAVNSAGVNPDWSNQNNAPVVSVGPDIATTTATVTLPGVVADDGKPVGGTLTSLWTKISGPGTVTFANANAASTTATFSAKGDYVLQLTASDTQLTTSAQLNVSYGTIALVKKYEAEAATYSGLSSIQDASASGGAYLQFRDTGTVQWTVAAASAGVAELAFGFRSPFGPKEQSLTINGSAQPNLAFPQATAWSELKINVNLNAGNNTVLVSKSWGWMDLDYVKVTTKDTAQTPPTVTLTSPTSGQVFALGSSITINANASDSDGTVSKVDFFSDGVLIGTDIAAPYTLVWPCGTTPGSPVLKAVATDNDGLTSEASVQVQVGNNLPVVSIVTPANAATVTQGSLVAISANASEVGGTISKVDFYIDGTLFSSAAAGTPFTASWTASTLGPHTIKAVATDAVGATASSSISISVVSVQGIQVSVTYTKNDWGNGFTANIVLKNTGTAAVSGWKLKFSFPGNQTITNSWSATFQQVGNQVTATNVDYNKDIAPGTSISIGFNANYSGSNVDPTDFVVTSN